MKLHVTAFLLKRPSTLNGGRRPESYFLFFFVSLRAWTIKPSLFHTVLRKRNESSLLFFSYPLPLLFLSPLSFFLSFCNIPRGSANSKSFLDETPFTGFALDLTRRLSSRVNHVNFVSERLPFAYLCSLSRIPSRQPSTPLTRRRSANYQHCANFR